MPDASRPRPPQGRTAPPQTQTRGAERAAPRPLTEPLAVPRPDTAAATAAAAKKAPALQMEAAIVTAGRAGETNITIEKFWVEVEENLPAWFNVATRDGHGLDVAIEQRSYRKSYSGTGTLKTGLTPVAPVGTKGKILVTDTTTGETLEQPWTWQSRGGGLGFWAAIKRLFWKG